MAPLLVAMMICWVVEYENVSSTSFMANSCISVRG